jgi:hypothetical protein
MISFLKPSMYFFMVTLVLSCHQRSTNNTTNIDSTCIADVGRAKKDVSNGKIVITSSLSSKGGMLRYEKELNELCVQYNLQFDYENFANVTQNGQTQGCYGTYMDKVIEAKFGTGFKSALLSKADSIYVARAMNDTIPYWNCDKQPTLLNNDPSDGDDMTAKIRSLDIRDDPTVEDVYKWPFMDIAFIVSPKGKISNFEISFFNPVLDWNKQFIDQLFEKGVATLKKNTAWTPCEIGGKKVWSKHSMRIRFEK